MLLALACWFVLLGVCWGGVLIAIVGCVSFGFVFYCLRLGYGFLGCGLVFCAGFVWLVWCVLCLLFPLGTGWGFTCCGVWVPYTMIYLLCLLVFILLLWCNLGEWFAVFATVGF